MPPGFFWSKMVNSLPTHDLSTNIRIELPLTSGGLNFAKQVPIKCFFLMWIETFMNTFIQFISFANSFLSSKIKSIS